jgi:hypothetical protein
MLAGVRAARPQGSPDGSWAEVPPLPRIGHTLLADVAHDRLLLVMGSSGSRWGSPAVFARPLDGPGPWERLETAGGPGPRVYASVVLDSLNNRIVLFGGRPAADLGQDQNDLWELPLDPPYAWQTLTATGTPPAPTARAPAMLDAQGRRMLVTGGSSSSSDVWALSLDGPPVWSRLAAPTPIPLGWASTAVLDPIRRRVILFGGGSGCCGASNRLWAFSLDPPLGWTLLFPPGALPPRRTDHTAVYDPLHDAMIVFGGIDSTSNLLSDAWSLDLGSLSWSLLPLAGSPAARSQHAAVVDASRGRMLVYGGAVRPLYAPYASVWAELDAVGLDAGSSWTVVDDAALPPPVWHGHQSVYDPVRDRMLAFGGFGRTSPLFAQLSLSPPFRWSDMPNAGGSAPPSRGESGVVYDPARDRVIVFGGQDASWPNLKLFNDLWEYRLGPGLWTGMLVLGVRPASRHGAVMIYDPIRDRLVLFGGRDSTDTRNDVWVLPLAPGPYVQWTQIAPVGAPPSPRTLAIGAYDPIRDRLVVIGGQTSTGYPFDDSWALNLSGTPQWTLLQPTGVPPNLGYTSGVFDPIRDRIVVPTRNPTGTGSLTAALEFGPPVTWTTLAPADPPENIDDASTSVLDEQHDRVLIFGGENDASRATWSLEFRSPLPPGIRGQGDLVWTRGTLNDVVFVVSNPHSFLQNVDWRLDGARSWPGMPALGSTAVGPTDSVAIHVGIPVPDSAADGLNEMMFRATLRTTAQVVNYQFHLHDVTTAALVSLVSADARESGARLVWSGENMKGVEVWIERSGIERVWRVIGQRFFDATGRLEFVDSLLAGGNRYGYRLRRTGISGGDTFGEGWIDVPDRMRFSLEGSRPNPAVGEIAAAFSVGTREPVRIELVDISGRRVRRRDIPSPDPGAHLAVLSGASRLPAGVYFIRLTQGPLRATRRVVLLR